MSISKSTSTGFIVARRRLRLRLQSGLKIGKGFCPIHQGFFLFGSPFNVELLAFTQKVLNALTDKIGEFCPNFHGWAVPEKFKTPALVYRVETKQTPLRFARWRTFPDKTRWAVSKVELDLHLFWRDKTPTWVELDNFLRKWRAIYIDDERVVLKYQPFTPYQEEEFTKKGLEVWQAILTAKFVEFVDSGVLEISVEVQEDGS